MTRIAYIGVKTVEAEPMTLGAYNLYRGWDIPADEDPAREGYLVVYPGGYESWCPKEEFEEANRPMDGMDFGRAIEAAKKGFKIARAGWNGKDMFVVYMPGYPEGIPANEITREVFGYAEGDLHVVRPYLVMRCVDGAHQMWLASQSDILEDDWTVVD